MAVAITGASGLIGTALAQSLTDDGIEVVRLVRRPAVGPGEVSWDPAKRTVDTGALAERSITAIVHLAGAGVGDRRGELSAGVVGDAAGAADAHRPGRRRLAEDRRRRRQEVEAERTCEGGSVRLMTGGTP